MPGRGGESVSENRTSASEEKAKKEVLQKLGNADAFDWVQAEWGDQIDADGESVREAGVVGARNGGDGCSGSLMEEI